MTDQPHLDDEALSAVLDGEGTPEDAAHVDGCGSCDGRLQVLRDASLLVRTPVEPAGADERDAAIAHALTGAIATVRPLRPRRPAPVWLAAAAVVAVVAIGAVAFAGRTDDGSGGTRDDVAAERSTEDLDSSLQAAPNAAVATVDGGDVGEVQGADLRPTIDGALSSARTGGVGGAAGDAAAGSTAGSPPAGECEASVRSGNPDLGPLVYRARGTFDGAAVTVLAFDTGDRRWVYVVADDCAIRNQTTYSPAAAP